MSSNFSDAHVIRKPVVSSSGGIVASQHKIASQVGAQVLAEGGNAMDAAVTTAFAVSVLEPWMSGIGGGGHLMVHDAPNATVHALDYGMISPLELDPAEYPLSGSGLSSDLFPWPEVVEDRNSLGPTAVAVPGQVDGMRVLLERFGTRSWEEVLAPATALAEEGMRIDWFASLVIGTATPILNRYHSSREMFLKDGFAPIPPWSPTTMLHKPFPKLAKTLRHLAKHGPREFYEGELARTMVADIRKAGGCISLEDLRQYEAQLLEPLAADYRGNNIQVIPELNAGPSLMEALGQLTQRLAPEPSPTGIAFTTIAEVLQEVYTARLERMGDVEGGRGTSCTTHLCVVDKDGSMVSLTQTLLSIFGSKFVLPESGILMNNGLMWFNPAPGHPNSMTPGKRALANTCPVIGLNKRGGFAVGASGGRKIMPAVLQLISFLLDNGMTLDEAIHHPRIDVSGGEVVMADRKLPEATQQALARKFSVHSTDRVAFPLPFACPSLVQREDGVNYGGTEISSPWADAVVQPET
ncbi:MAG: gamma-glutamyltransferase [Deltaproteobacteria bacterium]|nr:gamma-glutamyltransferase [Deltaproteobacteria bacterium]